MDDYKETSFFSDRNYTLLSHLGYLTLGLRYPYYICLRKAKNDYTSSVIEHRQTSSTRTEIVIASIIRKYYHCHA